MQQGRQNCKRNSLFGAQGTGKEPPVGQKNGGNPLGTFLLFISFCLIPVPGNPDAAAVVMAATVGQTPKIQPGELRS